MSRDAREFGVELLDWTEIHELADGWPPAKLLSLLSAMDVDGVTEQDALEMAIAALQDYDVDEAADLVLEVVFGDTMRDGVMQNLAHELTGERPWEEFADISHQAGIFNAVALLQQAFPREFDTPDAVSAAVRVETASAKGKEWLDAPVPDPALLLRILAAGMDDRSVLRRLFGDALAGTSFPEAAAVLWQVSRGPVVEPTRELLLTSSHQWLDPLRNLESWTATAWIDTSPDKRA